MTTISQLSTREALIAQNDQMIADIRTLRAEFAALLSDTDTIRAAHSALLSDMDESNAVLAHVVEQCRRIDKSKS